MSRRMTRRRSTGTLMALALIGGLALLAVSLWSAGGATAGPPPPDVAPQKRAAVAAKIEDLHNRAAARRVNREDERPLPPRPALSPEQAVQRALEVLSRRGDGGGQVLSVELQTPANGNGLQVYAVTVKTATKTVVVPINAATGNEVP